MSSALPGLGIALFSSQLSLQNEFSEVINRLLRSSKSDMQFINRYFDCPLHIPRAREKHLQSLHRYLRNKAAKYPEGADVWSTKKLVFDQGAFGNASPATKEALIRDSLREYRDHFDLAVKLKELRFTATDGPKRLKLLEELEARPEVAAEIRILSQIEEEKILDVDDLKMIRRTYATMPATPLRVIRSFFGEYASYFLNFRGKKKQDGKEVSAIRQSFLRLKKVVDVSLRNEVFSRKMQYGADDEAGTGELSLGDYESYLTLSEAIFRLLEKRNFSEDAFNEVLSLAEKTFPGLDRPTRFMVVEKLMNYVNYDYKRGNVDLFVHHYRLARFREKHHLLLSKANVISETAFLNQITVYCRAGQPEEAERFLQRYRKYLSPQIERPATRMGEVMILFENGHYENVLELLYSPPFYDAKGKENRKLLARATYQLRILPYRMRAALVLVLNGKEGDYERLFYRAANNLEKIYSLEHGKYPALISRPVLNGVGISKKILRAHRNDTLEVRAKELLAEIEAVEELTARSWFVQLLKRIIGPRV